MKIAVFGTTPYRTPQGRPTAWPVASASFDPEVGQQTMCEALELLERADQLGFDWVTCAEHHYSPFAMSPNPMLLAGALSQRTKRARIGVLGPTVPLLNPVRVAEEFALLDNLANGRVIVGLMRGTPFEYNTYSINPSESRERFEEALQLIVTAWTETQPFGWQGRYYRYRTISLWPKPVQTPYPPIFMSASSAESGRIAARNHLNIGMAATTVELAARSAQNYREAADEAGWTAIPSNILFRTHGCVAETDKEAWRIAEYFLERPVQLDQDTTRALRASGYFGTDVKTQETRADRPLSVRERVEAGYLFCGSPDTVFQQLCRAKERIGAGILELGFQSNRVPHEYAMQSVELFGTEVLPRLHAEQ